MIQKPTLIIVPFDDILDEHQPLDSMLWFLDYGFKDMIENIVLTVVEEDTQFDSLDIDSIYRSMYGKDLNELTIDELHHFLQIQDRCTVPHQSEHEEEILISLMIGGLVSMVERKLSLFLGDISTTEISLDNAPFWNGDRIVFSMKKY